MFYRSYGLRYASNNQYFIDEILKHEIAGDNNRNEAAIVEGFVFSTNAIAQAPGISVK